jgi:hypothetical protein
VSDTTCARDGGPAGCPFVVVACYCGETEGDVGWGGHDVCGGCSQFPGDCDCADQPEPVTA